MNDLWVRNDRPIPASYWVAATIGSLVVLVCYATAWWVPWFAEQMASGFMEFFRYGGALMIAFGGALGLTIGAAPWLALRWPALGIAIATLPVVPTLLSDAPLHFGVFAGLCAVAVTASSSPLAPALRFRMSRSRVSCRSSSAISSFISAESGP